MATFFNHLYLLMLKQIRHNKLEKCYTKVKKLSHQPRSHNNPQSLPAQPLHQPLHQNITLCGDQNSRNILHSVTTLPRSQSIHRYPQLRDMSQRSCSKHNANNVKSGFPRNLSKLLREQSNKMSNQWKWRRYLQSSWSWSHKSGYQNRIKYPRQPHHQKQPLYGGSNLKHQPT